MMGGMGGGSNVRRIATVLTAKDEASEQLNNAEAAGDDAADSMDSAEDSGAALAERFALLAGATAALTGAMGALVATHGRTEQMFNELGVVAAESDAELVAMRETALEVGATMPVSIEQATRALRQLSFSGFEAEEAMEAVEGVASLATASTLNVGQAARTSASMLNMFGMEADQIDRVTASLAATFSNAATNISELSKAVERAGGTASLLGADIEEVNAVLGTMAGAGIRASAAGTALNSMLTRLVSQSGQAEEAMGELGLSLEQFVDSEGEIKNLDVVMGEIVSSLDEMDNRLQQARVASQLFGQRGARAVLSVADEVDNIGQLLEDQYLAQIEQAIEQSNEFESTTEVVREFRDSGMEASEMAALLSQQLGLSEEAARLFAEELNDGSQSAEELATQVDNATTSTELMEAQLDSTQGSIQFLRSSFNSLTYSIYRGAGPAIQWFARRVATVVNFVGEYDRVNRRLGQGLAFLTGVLGAATLALGAEIAATKIAAAASGTYVGAALAKAGAAFTAASGFLAVSVAGAPVWAILLAIIGVTAALVAIWRGDLLGINDDVRAGFAALGEAAGWVHDKIDGLINIGGSLIKLFGTLAAAGTLAPLALFLRLGDRIRDVDWRGIGRSIPRMIAGGIRDAFPAASAAIGGLATLLRARLPFSPAETGPLSDLDAAGPALVQTLASGIDSEAPALSASLERALAVGSAITRPQRRAVGMATDAASSAAGGGDRYELRVEQEITVADADATEETVARASRRGASAFEQMMRRLKRETKTNP